MARDPEVVELVERGKELVTRANQLYIDLTAHQFDLHRFLLHTEGFIDRRHQPDGFLPDGQNERRNERRREGDT